MYHIFSARSFVDGQHRSVVLRFTLAVVINAAMGAEAHISLKISAFYFFGERPRSDIYFAFVRSLHKKGSGTSEALSLCDSNPV